MLYKNDKMVCQNMVDDDENPTGGYVSLIVEKGGEPHNALTVNWQDGPRGTDEAGVLKDPNGAFVEDVILAAIQRLEFFQGSKYESDYNAEAAGHLAQAIEALEKRSNERAAAGTLGKHEV